ncbi:uncharacterized protein LOC133174805 [Saccostrea echinata]|uniref:uncharacterized protein LOC133174805 n=1 Tax=Saccostrea echinata TaxID=191078 RepID=UPI002A82AF75|nr:uncharacterized protein LOC133174805 [Saccostrea echinata]
MFSSSKQSTRLIETTQSCRKIVTLNDASGEIEIKFWGNKTSLSPFEGGTHLTVTAVKVDYYAGRCSLNSTPSTAVQLKEDFDSLQGEIEAACFDDDNLSIMVGNNIFNISDTLLRRIFPNLKFCPGKTLMAITSSNQITDLVEVNNDHED